MQRGSVKTVSCSRESRGRVVSLESVSEVCTPRHAAQSAVSPDLVFQLAEEVKYGSVDAPFGTVAVGAVVVTGIALALTFGFKSGFEAQVRALPLPLSKQAVC